MSGRFCGDSDGVFTCVKRNLKKRYVENNYNNIPNLSTFRKKDGSLINIMIKLRSRSKGNNKK